MFFRKSKRDQEEEAKRQFLSEIDRACDVAKACPDTAEKYLKLVEAKARVDQADAVLRQNISNRATEKGQTMFLGTFGAGSTVGVLAMLGLHFPPLFMIAGPALGFYYGRRAGRDAATTSQAKALEENKEFFAALAEKSAKLNDTIVEVERAHLMELATSPRCEEILKKAPALRDQFAAAFSRQAAEDKARANPPPKPDGFKL